MNSNDTLLVRLAEIAASATALHRAMSGLPEPSATTELVNRVLDIAIGHAPPVDRAPGRDGGARAQADASSAETAIGGFEAHHPPSALQMVERWHQLSDMIGAAPPLHDGQPFDREALIRAGDQIHERADIEKQIVAHQARGDADLIAKAGALRRLLEEDGNAEDRLGKLTLSVLDDIEQIVGGEP